MLPDHGSADALTGIDGEMRAVGLRPDGSPWIIAVEAPDRDRRTQRSILTLQDAAVATSGDCRHWVKVEGRHLPHGMDLRRGAPLLEARASVTVLAPTCAEADARVTALMVKGVDAGANLARQAGRDALSLARDSAGGGKGTGVGKPFSNRFAASAPTVGD